MNSKGLQILLLTSNLIVSYKFRRKLKSEADWRYIFSCDLWTPSNSEIIRHKSICCKHLTSTWFYCQPGSHPKHSRNRTESDMLPTVNQIMMECKGSIINNSTKPRLQLLSQISLHSVYKNIIPNFSLKANKSQKVVQVHS